MRVGRHNSRPIACLTAAAWPEGFLGQVSRWPPTARCAIAEGVGGQADASGYDHFAVAYAQDREMNVWNASYERPATLALAGDVGGLRVLDAGWGSGALAPAPVGAVTGIDLSAGLPEIAARRLGQDVSAPG